MILETFKTFWDYELLDTGEGYRLEKWGKDTTGSEVVLARPDPQIIWSKSLSETEWGKAWAVYKSPVSETRGRWEIKKALPKNWIIKWQDVSFLLKLSPFKHTGLFAEQAANWQFVIEKLKDLKLKDSKPKILNLFAYTGGATMVLAKNGCQVTHVDASKPSITWANENYRLNFGNQNIPSGLAKGEHSPLGSVRWILDDCAKFVAREVKRGAKYDGVIMDPPAFGHSPAGKAWKFNEDLPGLLANCVKLLSENAQFLIINGYATNSSALALNNLLEDATLERKGKIEFGELCLKQKNKRLISTGIFARWQN